MRTLVQAILATLVRAPVHGQWVNEPAKGITGSPVVGRAKIVQPPGVIVVLFEDLSYRQIFMDGRALPVNPAPCFEAIP